MKETDSGKRQLMEIDLSKLFFSVLRYWWVVLICGAVFAVAMYVYSSRFVTPMYRASVTIYVNNFNSDVSSDSISSTQLTTSQRLVKTYINIIESDTVIDKVIEAAKLDITTAKFKSGMSATQVDDTEMFRVYVRSKDPSEAQKIANAIADVAPREIEKIINGSSTKIVDYAKEPTKPYTPNVRKNVIIGAAGGVALAVIILVLKFLLDFRIKDEADMEALFDVPILGTIPEFTTAGGKGYAYEPKRLKGK